MATMQLTTLARVKTILELNTTEHDAKLLLLINSASDLIERYLQRRILLTQWTDILDVEINQRKFWMKAYPIWSTMVPSGVDAQQVQAYYDIKRLFGTDTTLEDYNNYGVDLVQGQVVWEWPLNINRACWERSLKLIYNGGIAPTVDRLIGTYTAFAGVPMVGMNVTGTLYGTQATILAFAGGNFILQLTGGTPLPSNFDSYIDAAGLVSPIVGETFVDGTGFNSFTVATVTSTPLWVAAPALMGAADNQVMFMFQRRDSIGLQSLSTEGGHYSVEQPMQLTKMARQMIDQYRRYAVSH
jgi:hypothetical protein